MSIYCSISLANQVRNTNTKPDTIKPNLISFLANTFQPLQISYSSFHLSILQINQEPNTISIQNQDCLHLRQ